MSDSAENKQTAADPQAPQAPAKKSVYVAPKLRHLGSVRDLTLGSSQGTHFDAQLLPRNF
jgi:hypothetical protein